MLLFSRSQFVSFDTRKLIFCRSLESEYYGTNNFLDVSLVW